MAQKTVNDLIAAAIVGSDIPEGEPSADAVKAPGVEDPLAVESTQKGDKPAESQEVLADLWEASEADAPVAEESQLSDEDRALKVAKESDKPPDAKDQRAWGALKAQNKTYEEKIVEADAKAAKWLEELEAERKRREEIESRFEQVSLVDSPKFKQEYDEKIRRSLGQASRLLIQHAGIETAEAQTLIDKAIRLPFLERNRLLREEAPELEGTLSTILLQADEQILTRSEAIKNWKATNEALKETEVRNQQVRSSQVVNDALTQVIPELASEGNPFYRKTNGTSTDALSRNQAVDLRVNAIRQIVLKNDPVEMIRYVADGFVGRETRQAVLKYRDERDKARAELKEVIAQQPSVNGRFPRQLGSGELKGKTMDDLIASAFLG